MYFRISLLILGVEATNEGVQLLQRAASYSKTDQMPGVENLCSPDIDFTALAAKCASSNTLGFHKARQVVNNLGGFGPQKGVPPVIRLRDVLENRLMELVVSVTDAPGNVYQPNLYHKGGTGYMKNGVQPRGHYLRINMLTGTVTNFTFSFFDLGGFPMKTPESLFLTMVDFDEGRSNASREFAIIEPPCEAVFTVSADKELRADCETNSTTLISSHSGGKDNNPKNPRSLDSLQRKRSATCLLKGGIDKFTVKLGEINYAHEQGRNFFFAGPSSLVCTSFQSCRDYECPADTHIKKVDDENLYCRNNPCLENGEGRETCCRPK